MKYLILISVSFVLILNVNAQFSREEAIEIIKEDVISPDSLLSKELYSKYDKLIDGDTIYIEYYMGSYVNPFNEAWAFFIDDAPPCMWAHPCRIVFFDANSGDYQIINEDWPPYPFFDDIYQFLEEWEWIIPNELTREEAIEIVINEIIDADSLEYKQLFSRYEQFFYNDTLWMLEGDYYHLYSYYNGWVFFIDDAPIANWAHPSRIVFINAYGGNPYIIEDIWPPYPYFENWNLFLEQWEWITTVDDQSDIHKKSEFSVFPNPCKNFIQLKLKDLKYSEAQISITDLNGQIISSETQYILSELTEIKTTDLQPGMYFIHLTYDGHLLHLEKFLKTD